MSKQPRVDKLFLIPKYKVVRPTMRKAESDSVSLMSASPAREVDQTTLNYLTLYKYVHMAQCSLFGPPSSNHVPTHINLADKVCQVVLRDNFTAPSYPSSIIFI